MVVIFLFLHYLQFIHSGTTLQTILLCYSPYKRIQIHFPFPLISCFHRPDSHFCTTKAPTFCITFHYHTTGPHRVNQKTIPIILPLRAAPNKFVSSPHCPCRRPWCSPQHCSFSAMAPSFDAFYIGIVLTVTTYHQGTTHNGLTTCAIWNMLLFSRPSRQNNIRSLPALISSSCLVAIRQSFLLGFSYGFQISRPGCHRSSFW